MQTPVQIVFHEVAHSPALESLIRDHHEDVYVALRDAFDAARRQIEEHAQKMRREVKHHANGQPASGKQTGEQQ